MAKSQLNGPLSDSSGGTGPIAGLGAVVITAGRSFFSLLGGMSLLAGETAGIVLRGLVRSEERLGREALIFQMVRVGVKAAGRLLDGVEHTEVPK